MTTPTPDNSPAKDRLLDHSYDGIQEYDNPMPRWWLLTFVGTIVFSIIYLFNVGPVGSGPGRIADYEAEMAAFNAANKPPDGNDVSEERLLAVMKDRSELAEGQTIYAKNCAACHRLDGGGLIGPNLTDPYWIHGGAITDVYRTVVNGVLDKGMPPWGRTLKPKEVEEVVAYVASLKGATPPNPKAPQGVQTPP